MIKMILTLAVVAAAAKAVLDRVNNKRDADLWAEATDPVESSH